MARNLLGIRKIFLVWVSVLTLLFLNVSLVAGENSYQLQWAYKTQVDVQEVAISDDGRYLVAGAGDMLYFFSSINREPLWSFKTGSIVEISMTPDARYIAVATGYEGYKVYLFDRNGTMLWSRHLYEEYQGELTSTDVDDVAISADGRYVAAVGAYSVNLFSLEGRRLWYNWGYPTDPGSTDVVAISGEGSLIATGDYYGYLSLFTASGSWIGSLRISSSYGIGDIAVSYDGRYIVVSTFDTLALLDSRLNVIWSARPGSWSYVDMTPDASRIIVAADDGIYSFTTASNTPEWHNPKVVGINSISISSDGNYVVCGANDGVYFLNGTSGKILGVYPTEDIVEEVDVSKGGHYVVAGLFLKQVLLFSRNTPPELSNPSLSPLAGDQNTRFTYRVTYRDADGDEPRYVRVNIDGTYYDMVKVGGDYAKGAVFEFSIILPAGAHTYFFEAQDVRGGTARLPSQDVYVGPMVVTSGKEQTVPATGTQATETSDSQFPILPVALGVIAALAAIILIILRLR